LTKALYLREVIMLTGDVYCFLKEQESSEGEAFLDYIIKKYYGDLPFNQIFIDCESLGKLLNDEDKEEFNDILYNKRLLG
jgi:hypothetical protein